MSMQKTKKQGRERTASDPSLSHVFHSTETTIELAQCACWAVLKDYARLLLVTAAMSPGKLDRNPPQ